MCYKTGWFAPKLFMRFFCESCEKLRKICPRFVKKILSKSYLIDNHKEKIFIKCYQCGNLFVFLRCKVKDKNDN